MSLNARDQHAELPRKGYASVIFSSFFSGKDQSMNQFLGFFFFFHQHKIAFFFSKNTKKISDLSVSVSHTKKEE